MIRWTARILASLVTLFWLLAGILSGLNEMEPLNLESAIMTLLILSSTAFVVIAWFRERLGGLLLLLVGVGHSVFALLVAGHNHAMAVAISGLPYLIFGAMFLLSARHSDKAVAQETF
jgi:hypothetical protein